ncbi:MAG: sigma factor-like helix-turn-helix DNA-binding protein [Pseudomonadota bacterium]
MRLRALLTAHFNFVWRGLRRLGLSPADADDGAQKVFVIASRKLSSIASGSERQFLFRAALRVASKRRRGPKHAGEESRSERLTELEQARLDLNDILAAMKLEPRAVFVLYELEEMTVPEIASLLDLGSDTVTSRLRVAREEFDLSLRRLRVRGQSPGANE